MPAGMHPLNQQLVGALCPATTVFRVSHLPTEARLACIDAKRFRQVFTSQILNSGHQSVLLLIATRAMDSGLLVRAPKNRSLFR